MLDGFDPVLVFLQYAAQHGLPLPGLARLSSLVVQIPPCSATSRCTARSTRTRMG